MMLFFGSAIGLGMGLERFARDRAFAAFWKASRLEKPRTGQGERSHWVVGVVLK
jgi:hypothetical protein